jgi:hypothetical protein
VAFLSVHHYIVEKAQVCRELFFFKSQKGSFSENLKISLRKINNPHKN